MQEDWLARWRDGRIGFHEGRPNALLERHVARLAGCRRVLVPLCGKAEDLALLASHGHEVLGVELAEEAVRAFFAEHGLVPSIAPRGPFIAYQADAFTLLVGDFFAATPELLGPIDALYDRAALIALPAELRARYVARLRALLPAGAPALVITLEYDQRAMAGPPFAVLEPELRALWAEATAAGAAAGATMAGATMAGATMAGATMAGATMAGATIDLLEERASTGGGKCSQSGVSATERCFAIRSDPREPPRSDPRS